MDDFDAVWERLTRQERDTHDVKRTSYTGRLDPLANYRITSAILALWLDAAGFPDAAEFVRSRRGLAAMLTRLAEKLQRFLVLTASDDDYGEPVEDAAIDQSVIAKLVAIEYRRMESGSAKTNRVKIEQRLEEMENSGHDQP